MSNILITGASGFVGAYLSKKLSSNGNTVVGIVRDIIPSDWLNNALGKTIIVRGDIRDIKLLKRVIAHYDIDQVYHIAAAAQVKSAWKDPIDTFDSNVMGTLTLFEAIRSVDTKNKIKVVVLETDKCYGEKMDAVESDRYIESEPYATSKICQALITRSYIKTYGMNLKMMHSINIFGYDPLNSRLIGNVVKDCIRGINPVIRKNDKSIREYVYVDDAVDSLIRIMNDKTLTKSVYHIYTGWVYNQEDIILEILSQFPILAPIYDNVEIPYQIQNETLSSENWEWKPSLTFEDALQKTIRTYIEYRYEWDRS